jgi:hypothetical protein
MPFGSVQRSWRANSGRLSERDICTKFITPAIQEAGWDLQTQVREEVTFTAGRVIVRGRLSTRGSRKRADYILYRQPNLPVALIEAKDNNHPVGAGMQQALSYAEVLDIPFVFSSNGDAFLSHDRSGLSKPPERELQLEEFPSPAALWDRYRQWKGLSEEETRIVTQDYYVDPSGKSPRYYQWVAINRTVEAIAKGQNRILLVMATGTGKTYTAFQIIWRLWKAGVKKRILFLADRNILVDQTRTNDFKPFGRVMTKIRHRQVDKSYEVYLALYQAVTGTNGKENTATGSGALSSNSTGDDNTAIGANALSSNTTGSRNTATGSMALFYNEAGQNTATGAVALAQNTTGSRNTATGDGALFVNMTGKNNTATGKSALHSNTTGNDNTATGLRALYFNTTGSNNIAVGYRAGFNLGYVYPPTGASTYSHNIFIGNEGEIEDQNLIRIGDSGQSRTFIAGIDDQNLTVSAIQVCVEPTGQLGRCSFPSSREYKDDIQDMDAGTERLLALRPVTFRFKDEVAGEETGLQFGLIAEEVAEVYPELVSFDKEGRPDAVKYRFLSSLLLNELQKQATEIQRMRARLERLEATEPRYRTTGLRGPP